MTQKPLVIVESPAKAKTIGQLLGSHFHVMASIGHVVDLPSSGLCVNVEDDFKLTYEVTKKDVLRNLKGALKHALALYLATDEDREGEAIAWHLREQLKPKVPVHRMVFHEITKQAIQQAVAQSRDIDMGLVDAQEARRTLDRLYGYEVSPVLWRKVKTGLSAGRVQSPSIRLIVQRERERMCFRSAAYWDLAAFHPTTPAFQSTLYAVGDQRVANGRDFDDRAQLTPSNVMWLTQPHAERLMASLQGAPFSVKSLEKKPYRSTPKPPFITSTLQQEGGRKLHMSAQQLMRLAQGLYERGFITYMRTDSTVLSKTALQATRTQVAATFGDAFLPPTPRQYTRKVKNAQEAHEAIRPAGETFRPPQALQGELTPAELRLYELVWKRTLASQMADAEGESVTLKLTARSAVYGTVEFSAAGRTITFPGYRRAYIEGNDALQSDQHAPLPLLQVGDIVPVDDIKVQAHTTSPPARYTEASLVKKLEELGIGRPSTYASIIGTLQAKYVWKKGQALIPNWEAFAVVNLLEKHFVDLIDLAFTKELEEDLDRIATHECNKIEFLQNFYWGNKHKKDVVGLSQQVTQNIQKIDAAEVNSIPIGKDGDGVEISVKPGRYGPYIKRGEDTVSLPTALLPDELTIEKALTLLSAPKHDTPLGVSNGLNVYMKNGRFGPYVQLGELTDTLKPKTTSLFRGMKPEEVTLETALQLLSLPRIVGVAEDGEEVVAQNGRYGPYLTKGKATRSLGVEHEWMLLTLTLGEALEIFKQPKQHRQAKPGMRLGKDFSTGKDIFLKQGRFGCYVTDGETNASLRRGEEPATVTEDQASELLAERRAYLASTALKRRKTPRATNRKKARRPRRVRKSA